MEVDEWIKMITPNIPGFLSIKPARYTLAKSCLIHFCPIVALGIAVVLFSGCAFEKLEKEVAILDQTSILQGNISNPSPHKKPLIILLYRILDNEKKLVAYSIHHTPGTFRFVRLPGQYVIAAFEDANEDLVYQPTEYATYFNDAAVISVNQNEDHLDLNLTLRNPGNTTLTESPDLTSPATTAQLDLPRVQAGEIVTLKDKRFSKKNGQLGLWRPIKFLRKVGGGVFFLEPFDSEKIPVIFIHGVGGNPEQWTSMIQRLDRTRFQPWLVFYPSGLRLTMCTEFLVQSLSKIYMQDKFQKVVVMAHSMGGLLSRSLVNTVVEKDVEQKLKVLFLTLSTPWGGHQAAQIGVDHAPAVIPSWIDMIPNSPFQQELFATPLSDHVDYYLFFSFKGGHNPFTDGNDDGTVSLVSQLKLEAQDSAIKTIGFNETHDGILRSPHAIKKIGTLLTDFANQE